MILYTNTELILTTFNNHGVPSIMQDVWKRLTRHVDHYLKYLGTLIFSNRNLSIQTLLIVSPKLFPDKEYSYILMMSCFTTII